jgi:hypothetical protein
MVRFFVLSSLFLLNNCKVYCWSPSTTCFTMFFLIRSKRLIQLITNNYHLKQVRVSYPLFLKRSIVLQCYHNQVLVFDSLSSFIQDTLAIQHLPGQSTRTAVAILGAIMLLDSHTVCCGTYGAGPTLHPRHVSAQYVARA